MANSNPAFNNSPAFSDKPKVAGQLAAATNPTVDTSTMTAEQLTQLYSQPAATSDQMDRMSYQDTMVKILATFAVLLVGAAIGWFVPVLLIPGAIVGFVLSLVNIFKKKPSPALILLYSLAEGVFLGAITSFFEGLYPGIAPQAIIGTFAVVGVTLALFASGKVRASAKATRVFMIAIGGYLVFSLINVILMLTGVNKDAFGLESVKVFGIPLGIIIGVLVVLLAAYSLVLDFDSIKTGVTRGAPRIYGWSAAFGIMVTVIWLYLEILRILALARR